MVDRRTGAVALALLAFVFLIVAHADAGTFWSTDRHETWASEGYSSPQRLSGSVFSTTGDPDEIATVRPRDSGRLDGDSGRLLDPRIYRHLWVTGIVRSHSALFGYIAHFFQVAW